jgi:ABC-type multidrug transport system ATPase subunit
VDSSPRSASSARALRRGRTTLLVSHRVSAVREADRIVVLEAGRVLESGTPAELRARGGAFAQLERAQGRRERLLRELAARRARSSVTRAGITRLRRRARGRTPRRWCACSAA